LTGAFYLAKKRKAEDTGKAFVFKPVLEILLSLTVFGITAGFIYAADTDFQNRSVYIFCMVLTTAIVFLAIDAMAKRGFKKMGSSALRYVCMTGGSIIVSFALLSADGFGIGEYVPPLDKIESVETRIGNYDFNFDGADNVRFLFEDKADVELLRRANIESNNRSIGGWRYKKLNLAYKLTNGKTVSRNIDAGVVIEELLPLYVSDAYKAQFFAAIDDALASPDPFTFTARFEDITRTVTYFDTMIPGEERGVDARRLYQALREDYLNETFEQKFRSTGTTIGVVTFRAVGYNVGSHLVIHVRSHYANFLDELERQGIDIQTGLFASTEEPPYAYFTLHSGYIFGFYDPWDMYDYEDTWSHFTVTAANAGLLDELLKVAQPAYIIDGEGFYINLRGRNYYVPPEYDNLARGLWVTGEVTAGYYD
jgi:hypothetical protein